MPEQKPESKLQNWLQTWLQTLSIIITIIALEISSCNRNTTKTELNTIQYEMRREFDIISSNFDLLIPPPTENEETEKTTEK